MQSVQNFRSVIGLLITFLLIAPPLVAQQKRPPVARKAPAAQPVEPVPTFETLLTDESYKVYSEVRNVGTLVTSPSLNDVLEPVIKMAAPPREFRSVVRWIKAHAEALADSRMFIAAWPGKTNLPATLVAVEFASPVEAKKFEGELRAFVPTLAPKPSPAPSVSSPGSSQAVPPGPTVTPTQNDNSAVLPAFHIRQAGSLVLLSEKPISFRDLRPKGSRLLAEDPNFVTARNRFASESLFVYVDLKAIEKEEQEQRKKWDEEERLRREREAANPIKDPHAEDVTISTSPGIEDHPPVRVDVQPGEIVTETRATDAQAADRAATSRPPSSDEIGFEFLSIYGALFGGPTKWPEAIGIAAAFDDDGYAVRALVINSGDSKSVPIPFMSKVVSGAPLIPSSPNIFPADTTLFVSLSLDYPQIYEAILKSFASGEPGLGNFRRPGAPEAPRGSPFAAYEKRLGLKIKDDLLPLLGSEIAFAIPKPKPPREGRADSSRANEEQTPPKTEGPRPATPGLNPVIAISLKDKEAFRRLIPKMIEAIGFKGADLFAHSEKREETEIVTYASAFSYAFVGDFFVFSTAPDLTRQVVDSYLNHQTLSTDVSFRHATRWQPRQLQGQVYVAPSIIDLYYPLGLSAGSSDNDKVRDLMSRVNPVIEPLTYALSNEGLGPLHEIHIPKNLLMMAIFGISSQASQAPQTTNESIAKSMLRTVVSAEVTFQSTKGEGRYGSLDELVAEGLLSKDLLERYGYRIELAVLANKFEATAVPLEYGKSGKMSFFVDETGVLRGGDHGGGAATISDNPVD